MRAVTPLLRVDDGPEAMDVEEAFVTVKLGDVAVVTDDEDAREVLRLLGLREELVEDRIHFSHTGEVTLEG